MFIYFILYLWLVLFINIINASKISLHNITWQEIPSSIPLQQRQMNLYNTNTNGILASDIIHQPVYVSLTTVAHRIQGLPKVIKKLLSGSLIPTHIYIFISKEPYLMDDGIPIGKISKELLGMMRIYPISIVYTENIGPHRKLLPLLAHKYEEDCVIISIDDDVGDLLNVKKVVAELLLYYRISGRNSIIALQARRIGYCLEGNSDSRIRSYLPYNQWNHAIVGSRELLVLPIGTGGVLYRPKWFHPIVFNREYQLLGMTNDDITFRLATLINQIPVVVGCWKKSVDTSSISCTLANFNLEQRRSLTIAPKERRRQLNTEIQNLKKKNMRELWRLNCNSTRNDAMLPNSAEYLKKLKLLDLMALSESKLVNERKECFEESSTSSSSDRVSTTARLKRCNIEFNCRLKPEVASD